jgi:hypothetical protein
MSKVVVPSASTSGNSVTFNRNCDYVDIVMTNIHHGDTVIVTASQLRGAFADLFPNDRHQVAAVDAIKSIGRDVEDLKRRLKSAEANLADHESDIRNAGRILSGDRG